jgi:DNA-directed RNA polymerase alpha subunit
MIMLKFASFMAIERFFEALIRDLSEKASGKMRQAEVILEEAQQYKSLIQILKDHRAKLLMSFARTLRQEQKSSTSPDRYNEICWTPIEHLFPGDRRHPLDNRIYNALKRSGIMDAGQVLEKEADGFLVELKGMGPKTHEHLIQRLKDLGFWPWPEEGQEEKGPSAIERVPQTKAPE